MVVVVMQWWEVRPRRPPERAPPPGAVAGAGQAEAARLGHVPRLADVVHQHARDLAVCLGVPVDAVNDPPVEVVPQVEVEIQDVKAMLHGNLHNNIFIPFFKLKCKFL